MPRFTPVVILFAVSLPGLSLAEESFDGKWLTTVSCAAAGDALGYSYRFTGEVKNGKYRGLYGSEGTPGSLLVEGTVSGDGDGKLYATGWVGSKDYVPGRSSSRGAKYGYSVEAHFKGATGTGSRIQGRSCSFQFDKQ